MEGGSVEEGQGESRLGWFDLRIEDNEECRKEIKYSRQVKGWEDDKPIRQEEVGEETKERVE